MNKVIENRLLVFLICVFLVHLSNTPWAEAEDKILRYKVVSPPALLFERDNDIELIQNYGSFSLYRISETALMNIPSNFRAQIRIADEMDTILLDAHPFNTQTDTLVLPAQLRSTEPPDKTLQLIQFVGPIKSEWLQAVEETGVTLVHYIANNASLIWSDPTSRARLDILPDSQSLMHTPAYTNLTLNLDRRFAHVSFNKRTPMRWSG